MTITTCDLCGKEMPDKDRIMYVGAGVFRMLAAKEFCTDGGKPVVPFLTRVEQKRKPRHQLAKPSFLHLPAPLAQSRQSLAAFASSGKMSGAEPWKRSRTLSAFLMNMREPWPDI